MANQNDGSSNMVKSIAAGVAELPEEINGLAALLMLASSEERNGTTQQLADSYKRDAERLRATLELVREDVLFALDGLYQPSGRQLERALFPNDKRVEARMADTVSE